MLSDVMISKKQKVNVLAIDAVLADECMVMHKSTFSVGKSKPK